MPNLHTHETQAEKTPDRDRSNTVTEATRKVFYVLDTFHTEVTSAPPSPNVSLDTETGFSAEVYPTQTNTLYENQDYGVEGENY